MGGRGGGEGEGHIFPGLFDGTCDQQMALLGKAREVCERVLVAWAPRISIDFGAIPKAVASHGFAWLVPSIGSSSSLKSRPRLKKSLLQSQGRRFA